MNKRTTYFCQLGSYQDTFFFCILFAVHVFKGQRPEIPLQFRLYQVFKNTAYYDLSLKCRVIHNCNWMAAFLNQLSIKAEKKKKDINCKTQSHELSLIHWSSLNPYFMELSDVN